MGLVASEMLGAALVFQSKLLQRSSVGFKQGCVDSAIGWELQHEVVE